MKIYKIKNFDWKNTGEPVKEVQTWQEVHDFITDFVPEEFKHNYRRFCGVGEGETPSGVVIDYGSHSDFLYVDDGSYFNMNK